MSEAAVNSVVEQKQRITRSSIGQTTPIVNTADLSKSDENLASERSLSPANSKSSYRSLASTPTQDTNSLTPAVTPDQSLSENASAPPLAPPPVLVKRKMGVATAATPQTTRRSLRSNKLNTDEESDKYCWICRKDGIVMPCQICPRVYHLKCLGLTSTAKDDWICVDCEKVMRSECEDTKPRALTNLSVDQLITCLQYSLERMKVPNSEVFQVPVDPAMEPEYHNIVVHPMDMSTLEKNISKKLYGSTEAFLVDAKWILHNSIIYNGMHNKYTMTAKAILKMCRHQMTEIETCPDCFLASCTQESNWFCKPCRFSHPLVWAKLKGYPFWPAKALREVEGQVDCRFFGAHDKAWVPAHQVFMLSAEPPVPVKNKKGSGFEDAMNELEKYITKFKARYGLFTYGAVKEPYRSDYGQPATSESRKRALSPSGEFDSPPSKKPTEGSVKDESDQGEDSTTKQDTPTIKSEPEKPGVFTISDDLLASVKDSGFSMMSDEELSPNATNSVVSRIEEKLKSAIVAEQMEPAADEAPTSLSLGNGHVKQNTEEGASLTNHINGSPNSPPSLIPANDSSKADPLPTDLHKKASTEASEPESEPLTLAQPSTQPLTLAQLSTQPLTLTQLSTQPLTLAQPSTQPLTLAQPSTQPLTLAQPSTQPLTLAQPSTQPLTLAQPSTQPLILTQPSIQPLTLAQPSTQPLTSKPLNTILVAATNDLVVAPNDLAAAPNDLAAAPKDLAAAPNDLAAAPNDLAAAPNDLAAAPNVLAAATNDLAAAPNDLAAATNDLAAATNGEPMNTNSTASLVPPTDEVYTKKLGQTIDSCKSQLGMDRNQEVGEESVQSDSESETDSEDDVSYRGRRFRRRSNGYHRSRHRVDIRDIMSDKERAVTDQLLDMLKNGLESTIKEVVRHTLIQGKLTVSDSKVTATETDAAVAAAEQKPVADNKSITDAASVTSAAEPGSLVPTLVDNISADEIIKHTTVTPSKSQDGVAKGEPLAENTNQENSNELSTDSLPISSELAEKLAWKHKCEIEAVKHNAELAAMEMRKSIELEKERALWRLRKQLEHKFKKIIEETKKKQWCAMCGKEAIFYCCWNTSYCDYPCQQKHWPSHLKTCAQISKEEGGDKKQHRQSPAPNTLNSESGRGPPQGSHSNPAPPPYMPTPSSSSGDISSAPQYQLMQGQVQYMPATVPANTSHVYQAQLPVQTMHMQSGPRTQVSPAGAPMLYPVMTPPSAPGPPQPQSYMLSQRQPYRLAPKYS